jgi:hypothetical protein
VSHLYFFHMVIRVNGAKECKTPAAAVPKKGVARMRLADADNEWLAMRNPSLMDDKELADELSQAEVIARKLGGNWQAEQRLFRLRAEIAFRSEEEPTMTGNPADEISQREKRRILAEDRQVRTTYLHHAESSVDDDRGGRYAAIEKSATVVGAGPVSYPQQPPTSPWHHDPIGDEPPLGYSVDAIEPAGEKHERGDASTGQGNTSPRPVEDAAAAATVARHPVAVAVKSRVRRRM